MAALASRRLFLIAALAVAIGALRYFSHDLGYRAYVYDLFAPGEAPAAFPEEGAFVYPFNTQGTLNESGTPDGSGSPYWWLNSGGQLVIENGVGRTIQGELPLYHRWTRSYAESNPSDSGGGRTPQNLFRLILRSEWENAAAELSFRVAGDNLADSPNRNESNGIFLMLRYRERGDTLYYAGVRVDGHAVIKKKFRGVYHTLAETPFIEGRYDRDRTPNLLPHGEWIRIRAEAVTERDGSVKIVLYAKRPLERSWRAIAEAKDRRNGGSEAPPIIGEGAIGIRSDFMDLEFDDFRVEGL